MLNGNSACVTALITQILTLSVQQEHKPCVVCLISKKEPKQCFRYDDKDAHNATQLRMINKSCRVHKNETK